MKPSGFEPATIWLVDQGNKTAIILPSPIDSSPITHIFHFTQSELFAVSPYKTQTTNPYVHLPSLTVVILHKQSVSVDTYSPPWKQMTMCLVGQSEKCRCIIVTVNKTTCRSKLAANQKSVAKRSAFSSSWQSAVGWLQTVC
jgi:hypothetical protein